MRRPNPILALIALLAFVVSSQPSSFDVPVAQTERQIRWPTKTIQIALSTSLTAPSPAIKPESDVAGAVKRALASWSRAAGITFVEASSPVQSVSPVGRGDGVNLITIAGTTENLEVFGKGNTTARTRVFFDPDSGDITEADILLNPYPYSESGSVLQFSTDASPGTYDLESTLAHELGHFLGLDHSQVIGATMQAAQALNGTYDLPAITERSLSDADQAAVRSLYGFREQAGSIEGKLLNSIDGNLVPAAAHVWLEDLATGRVVASCVTIAGGRFSFNSVPPGNYRAMVEYLAGPATDVDAFTAAIKLAGRTRAFRSVEISSRLRVFAARATTLNYVLVPPQNSAPTLNPRFIGINGELSSVPIPVAAGSRITLHVGGEKVDQVPGSNILVSSPFVRVDPASLALEQLHTATPVISFEVTVPPNTPPGDYTVRLQSTSGEIAYLVGALTVEPAK